MTNRSKTKGTHAETAVVTCLREEGAVNAERLALQGNKDRGDTTGLPGVMIEVKNCTTVDLAGWLKEVQAQKANARADIGFVWHKKRGTTDPRQWYVTMTGQQIIDILRMTGHLPPPGPLW